MRSTVSLWIIFVSINGQILPWLKSFEFINLVINTSISISWGNSSILNCIFLILTKILVK